MPANPDLPDSLYGLCKKMEELDESLPLANIDYKALNRALLKKKA